MKAACFAAIAVALMATGAKACLLPYCNPDWVESCSPAPSCWVNSGQKYLRSICRSYASGKFNSAAEIRKYGWFDDPQNTDGPVDVIVDACRNIGIPIVRP